MPMMNKASRRQILVIDDNESILSDFRKILEQQVRPAFLSQAKAALFGSAAAAPPAQARPEFSVDTATSGQEALEKVRSALASGRPYMVAFVDLRMPSGWDGLETIKRITSLDAEIQIVVCTAFSDHSLDDLNHALDCTDRLLLLKKPFDGVEVLQAANALSEKWILRQAAGLKLGELERMVQERTAQIEHALLHDKLTGLPNRTLLLERIGTCLERQKRHPHYRFAVLFLDFDRFKIVNDSLGHETGDLLLIEVAGRLRNCLRGGDLISHSGTAARLGGDEFCLLVDDLREQMDAARIAERVLNALAPPHTINGQAIYATASIGIAVSDRAYQDAGELIRDADTAMYRAKASGRARYVLFDSRMHEEVSQRLSIENALRKAVQDSEFRLYYQPILRLSDMRLAGFEALLRWKHPERGIVSAAEIIPIAEDTGLVLPLGLWVLRTACGQLRTWLDRYPQADAVRIGVNISRKQLIDAELASRIGDILRETGVDTHRLVLEITESTVLDDAAAALRVLETLRNMGVWLHLDDFGTGRSSLGCLYQLPLSGLKIDRSFLAATSRHQEPAVVLESVVNIARAFNLCVVAEGVETQAQTEILRRLRCDYVQGFLYAPPQPAEEAEEWIRNYLPSEPVAVK